VLFPLPLLHVFVTVELVLLRYPGQLRRDINTFRQVDMRLRQTGSVIPTAHVNAVGPRTVLTPANEG
jgi:hypothetical protein